MFCPECGAEFRSGFTECNSCEVALVEESPEPTGPTYAFRELAIVGRYLHPAEAVTLQCALRGAGFSCWLLNEHLVSLYWLVAPALGGINVVVDAEDREEVEEWLSNAVVETPPLPSDEYQSLRSSPKRRVAILLTWLGLISNHVIALIIAFIIYKNRQRHIDLDHLEDVFS